MQKKQLFKYTLLFTPVLSLMFPTFYFINGTLLKAILLFVSPLVFIISITISKKNLNEVLKIIIKFKYLILFCILYAVVEFYHASSISELKQPTVYAFTMILPLLSCELLLGKNERQSYFCFVCECITWIGLITIGYMLIMNMLFIMNNFDYEIFYVDDFLMRYQVIEILNIKFKQRVILTEMARYASIFKNPNTFGHLLAFSAMWMIHKCFINTNAKKTINILKVTILVYGIYLTGSKNSMLFLVVFYILYIAINLFKYYRTRKAYLKISIIICMFISVFMSLLLAYRGYGTTGRFDLWVYSIKLIKNKICMGYGSRAFNEILWNATENHGAHNSFIHILGVGGIVLMIPFLIFLKKLLKKIFESITITNTNYFSFIFSFFIASFIYQISENHALVLTWPCLIYLKSYYLLLNTKKDALNL